MTSVLNKMRESRLRVFEHAKMRCTCVIVRRCGFLTMVALRIGTGRSKNYCKNVIR